MIVKLKTFQVLAECGSYTETAKQLFCSQPSVSQHIRFLEEHYGTKLVTRRNNRIELTERGVVLHKQAEKLFKVYEETEKIMSAAKTNQAIALYMSNYIAEYYYTELFGEKSSCCQAYPWEINAHCYKDLRESLVNEKTKFAIMPIYPADTEIQQFYDIHPLFEEELHLVFSAQHPLASRKVIYAKDLENLVVMQTQSEYMQNLVKQVLKAKGTTVLYKQMTDFTIIKKALLQSSAVSFMPSKVLDSTDSLLVCRSVKGIRIVRSNGLVIHPNQRLTATEQAFCTHISEKLSSNQEQQPFSS